MLSIELFALNLFLSENNFQMLASGLIFIPPLLQNYRQIHPLVAGECIFLNCFHTDSPLYEKLHRLHARAKCARTLWRKDAGMLRRSRDHPKLCLPRMHTPESYYASRHRRRADRCLSVSDRGLRLHWCYVMRGLKRRSFVLSEFRSFRSNRTIAGPRGVIGPLPRPK